MTNDPRDSRKREAPAQRGLRSPLPALAGGTLAGVGVLTSVYAAANHGLTGWHLLVAIMFGGCALALTVEAFYRSQGQVPWQRTGALSAVCAIASFVFVALPTHHQASATTGAIPQTRGGPAPAPVGDSLQLSLRPIPRELFYLAFYKPIPLPKPNEGARQLLGRGGVEVGSDKFRMILANRGTEPISVLSVRIEVLGSQPRPEGTLAYQFSQGDEGLAQLTATIPRAARGTVAHLYESSRAPSNPAERKRIPSYFETTYILLRPGEVYPASLTVRAESRRLIRFRFVAEGRSAGHHFVQRSPAYSLVGGAGFSGEGPYDRTYVDGQFPHICTATPESPWYDARFSYENGSNPCPEGAEAPEEIIFQNPSAYPRGHFRLDLGLESAAQSAKIDGIDLGAPPAATSRSSVVMPLIRELGAWSTCVDRWPVPESWTANWERWGLFLVFAGEGSEACTPQSRSRIRQIELTGDEQVIHTNRGSVVVAGPQAKIPTSIREVASGEADPYGSEFLVKGVSACDPRRVVDRPQVRSEDPGGILALHVLKRTSMTLAGQEIHSSEIDKAVTTLSDEKC